MYGTSSRLLCTDANKHSATVAIARTHRGLEIFMLFDVRRDFTFLLFHYTLTMANLSKQKQLRKYMALSIQCKSNLMIFHESWPKWICIFNKFANKIIIETISPKITGETQQCKKYTTDWRASLKQRLCLSSLISKLQHNGDHLRLRKRLLRRCCVPLHCGT